MDIRRIEIADLSPPVSASGELDLEAVLAATLDPNMPLDRLLNLRPGDSIQIAAGRGVVHRAGGQVEPINLPEERAGWDHKFVRYGGGNGK